MSTSSFNDFEQLSPAQLIDRHSSGVWRYLRMLGCDDSKADDLTQETFLRVLRRDTFVQHNEAATAGYLRRTAYNLLVSDHRKHSRVTTVPDAATIDEIWDRWAGKDVTGNRAIDALKVCFSNLTQRAQTALTMRYKDEATRIQIAAALGISDHGARNLMQRAKSKLKICVEGKIQDQEDPRSKVEKTR
jgi:RNA polymerase sigma-70 factor (ECF subfamily)